MKKIVEILELRKIENCSDVSLKHDSRVAKKYKSSSYCMFIETRSFCPIFDEFWIKND